MKTRSQLTITFGTITILGPYESDSDGRRGIIEGETIALPSTYAITAERILKGEAVTITDNGNRETTLTLTTVEHFQTPEAAWSAFLAHERAWSEHPKTAPLTIGGILTYAAGCPSRSPELYLARNTLHISYSFTCGKLTIAAATE